MDIWNVEMEKTDFEMGKKVIDIPLSKSSKLKLFTFW